jgi:hypothetical protein
MDKKEALITLCKDLRLPSIRRMVKEGVVWKSKFSSLTSKNSLSTITSKSE